MAVQSDAAVKYSEVSKDQLLLLYLMFVCKREQKTEEVRTSFLINFDESF